ncbi:unnamed protein product [Gordionus sp. m RMFG-2023]
MAADVLSILHFVCWPLTFYQIGKNVVHYRSFLFYIGKVQPWCIEFCAASVNWITALIAFDRFYAISSPYSYSFTFTRRKITKICVAIIFANMCLAIPFSLIWNMEHNEGKVHQNQISYPITPLNNSNNSAGNVYKYAIWPPALPSIPITSLKMQESVYAIEKLDRINKIYDPIIATLNYLIPVCISILGNICILLCRNQKLTQILKSKIKSTFSSIRISDCSSPLNPASILASKVIVNTVPHIDSPIFVGDIGDTNSLPMRYLSETANEPIIADNIRTRIGHHIKNQVKVLILAQSIQIFCFNIPFIVFVYYTGYFYSTTLDIRLSNIQFIVHYIKHLNALIGVYINLFFDNNVRLAFKSYIDPCYQNIFVIKII